MQIKLLGTASAEGFPALFCRCPVCQASRKRAGKDFRTRTSALIDGRLKIDLPPDTLVHVQQGLDLTAIDSLFFTHSHDDHCAVSELQYMSWMFVTEQRPRPLPIYGPEPVIANIRRSLDLGIVPVTLHCLDPWETVRVGPYDVTAVLAAHDPDQICFNYVVRKRGAAVLYATDTGWYSEETWRFLEGTTLDAIVVECSKGTEGNGYEGHLSVSEVIRMHERLLAAGTIQTNTPFVTTHHSHLSGFLHEDLEGILISHGIQAGYDGMVIGV